MRWRLSRRQEVREALDALGANARLAVEARPRRRPRDLLVVNLSYDDAPTLRHVDFGGWTLDLADRDQSYFLTLAEAMVTAVDRLTAAAGLGRVCFFGLSKGGHAALLLSRLLAQRRRDLRVGAVALGPLTRLWPRDDRIGFPSYADLLARAERDPALAAVLVAYGDQTRDASLPNLRWIVGYGVRSKRDARAALALAGTSLTLLPVPLSSHGVLIPFLCQRQPPDRVSRIVAAAARNGEVDRDLRSDALSADGALMLAEISAMLPLPTVAELVRHAVRPRPFASLEGRR